MGVSSRAFGDGIITLNVKIKRDNGTVRIGIIDSKRVYKIRECYQELYKYSAFMYKSFGGFMLNGKQEDCENNQKLENLTELMPGSGVNSFVLDLNQCNVSWIKKKKNGQIIKQRTFESVIKHGTNYKFFIAMSQRNDCVSASY